MTWDHNDLNIIMYLWHASDIHNIYPATPNPTPSNANLQSATQPISDLLACNIISSLDCDYVAPTLE